MKKAVILICADAEWQAVRLRFADQPVHISPYGEYLVLHQIGWRCTFFQTGWGKIAASAAAQYALDKHEPDLLINLGTCGGFDGRIKRGQIVLVNKTIVYDIFEKMGDPESHIAHYITDLDLSWITDPLPDRVQRAALVSGDRDLDASQIPDFISQYGAVAGDWESGAIAWVAKQNQIPLLILRIVSDLVSQTGSPAYGNLSYFQTAAFEMINMLLDSLPDWLEAASIRVHSH